MPFFKTALILLALIAFPAAAADSCLKQVFDKYCLGGSLRMLLSQEKSGAKPQVKGERAGVVYQEANEKVYVMAYKDVIYKVVHTYEPETQATLKDLRRRLQRNYGTYQDQSHYPDNTRNRARQVSSIRRGEGEEKNVWQPSNQPWRVELGWTRQLGVYVAFYHNELDARQKEAARQGL
jgi:hypothetical protein